MCYVLFGKFVGQSNILKLIKVLTITDLPIHAFLQCVYVCQNFVLQCVFVLQCFVFTMFCFYNVFMFASLLQTKY